MYLMVLEVVLLGILVFVIAPILLVSSSLPLFSLDNVTPRSYFGTSSSYVLEGILYKPLP